MHTINGFLWFIETDTEPYYYYTSDENHPELPDGHHATFYGGGLIDIHALRNATVKDGIVRTFSSDIARQVEALKVLLSPQE